MHALWRYAAVSRLVDMIKTEVMPFGATYRERRASSTGRSFDKRTSAELEPDQVEDNRCRLRRMDPPEHVF